MSTGIDAATAQAVAVAFMRALVRHGWADAAALADLDLPTGAEPQTFLHDLWSAVAAQLGAPEALVLAGSTPHAAGHAVDAAARFPGRELTLRVVVGAGGRVVGFWLTPPRRIEPSTPGAA